MDVVERAEYEPPLTVEPAQHGVEKRGSPVCSRLSRQRWLEKPFACEALQCLSHKPEGQHRVHRVAATKADPEVRARELAGLVENGRLTQSWIADHEQGPTLALPCPPQDVGSGADHGIALPHDEGQLS